MKELVDLPWVSRHIETEKSEINVKDMTVSAQGITKDAESESISNNMNENKKLAETDQTSLSPRILYLRHFTQALKEITPSSSEALGSLADLRKWNEEFGEGRRNRKKRQVWGKGRFGFIHAEDDTFEEGRVG